MRRIHDSKDVIVCVVQKLKGLIIYKCKPYSPGRKVDHWLKGGEQDASLRLFSHYSSNVNRHNFLHKNIKTFLSRPKKGTFGGLAGVALSRG
jgi:hypothetical protein